MPIFRDDLEKMVDAKEAEKPDVEEDSLPIEVEDRDVDFMLRMATSAYEDERYESAAKMYWGVICARPRHISAHVGFGSCKYMVGDLRVAEDSYRNALRLEPKNQEALLYLGEMLWHGRGEAEDALRYLGRANGVDPASPIGVRAQVTMEMIKEKS